MNVLKIAIAGAFLMLVVSFAAAAQDAKPGYIYFSKILEQMPKYTKMTKDFEAYKKTFDDMYQNLKSEYDSSVKDFEAKQSKMTDKVRKQSEAALADFKDRLEDYQNQAKEKVDKKRDEQMAPFLDEIITAVLAVAKEKGYTYVLDSWKGVTIVPANVDDFMAALKLKLRLK